MNDGFKGAAALSFCDELGIVFLGGRFDCVLDVDERCYLRHGVIGITNQRWETCLKRL